MALFEIPKEITNKNTTKNKVKLKKGQTLYDLIDQAEKIVNEKLGNYKQASKCVTNLNDLQRFFDETPDDSVIRYRY